MVPAEKSTQRTSLPGSRVLRRPVRATSRAALLSTGFAARTLRRPLRFGGHGVRHPLHLAPLERRFPPPATSVTLLSPRLSCRVVPHLLHLLHAAGCWTKAP
jgi:hypothetical protein